MADDFFSWPRVNRQGNLIGHGSGRTKKPSFVVESLSRCFLQFNDRGIFPENVIAQRRLEHEFFHVGSWLRNGIASKINLHDAKITVFLGVQGTN